MEGSNWVPTLPAVSCACARAATPPDPSLLFQGGHRLTDPTRGAPPTRVGGARLQGIRGGGP
eukprot:12894256-Alexandrium_andersonii.AAC.1